MTRNEFIQKYVLECICLVDESTESSIMNALDCANTLERELGEDFFKPNEVHLKQNSVEFFRIKSPI